MSETHVFSVSANRVPVSIVCVYNDAQVLESCLERSIEVGLPNAPATELIKIDNRMGAFKTAGSALNYGAQQAKNQVIVFVHQDVILESLPALETAAGLLEDSSDIGMIGAVGMDRRRRVIGQMRDRVVRIGEPAPRPRDVDTVDEVLFMARRELLIREPLADEANLAWHAYAAEYGLRLRQACLRVAVVDIPLTHNSLTTNLERLNEAHEWLALTYPQMLPIVTTCGIITDGSTPMFLRQIGRRVRTGLTWWKESRLASRVLRETSESNVVLADIRLLIDEVANLMNATEIRVLDIERKGVVPMNFDGIERSGRLFSAVTAPLENIDSLIAGWDNTQLLLITNLEPSDINGLHSLPSVSHVVGHWFDTGLWVLVGSTESELHALWPRVRNRPYAGVMLRRTALR